MVHSSDSSAEEARQAGPCSSSGNCVGELQVQGETLPQKEVEKVMEEDTSGRHAHYTLECTRTNTPPRHSTTLTTSIPTPHTVK